MSELIEDLLKLHREMVILGSKRYPVCMHCYTGDPYSTRPSEWPCPTAKLVLRHAEESDD